MARYARSQALYEEAQRFLPGGVSSNFRLGVPPFPLFFERAEGSKIYDVDGNEYVDYQLGMGPIVLGHNHPGPVRASEEWLRKGQLFGGQSVAEVDLGRRYCEAVPCADQVRFGGSGSEVVQLAWRLARAATGKPKILRFEGHYHGWIDSALISVPGGPGGEDTHGPAEPVTPQPGSRGQSPGALEDVLLLPWNDLALVRRTLEARAGEIAAVIMEPVLCNTCVVPPEPGFLEGVRDLCTRLGVLLIFDEVITGFRLSLGGAQARLGVTPDLATFAKAMANGFPIAAAAGRREILDALNSGTVHGGTYNAAASTAAAGAATLDELARDGGAAYRRMDEAGAALMEGLRDVARRAGQPLHVQGFGQVFHTSFTDLPAIRSYRDYQQTDTAKLGRFIAGLMDEGVRVTSRGCWYTSAAHTAADVEATLRAAERVVQRLSPRQHPPNVQNASASS
jgi:glutamate-1-semialdehyde 2,1-aminomutase